MKKIVLIILLGLLTNLSTAYAQRTLELIDRYPLKILYEDTV